MAALKKAREQTTQTAIENSSLRANQVRAKEQFNNHVKRLETDVNFEREQVTLVTLYLYYSRGRQFKKSFPIEEVPFKQLHNSPIYDECQTRSA